MDLKEKIEKKVPLSIGETVAHLEGMKQRNKETALAHKKKQFPIHYSKPVVPVDRQERKFLGYCLSLIKESHPKEHDLLVLTLEGWNARNIWRWYQRNGFENISLRQVQKMIDHARNLVNQKILHLRRHGTPIFSDLPQTPSQAGSLV